MEIQAVLFDYGMVLTGPADAAARRRMETLLEADAKSFDAAYWRFRDAYDRGALSGATYWKAVATELGRELEAETLAGLIDADTTLWTQPNDEMIAWAAKLQRAGVRTGILSNLGDAMEAGITARFKWLDAFTHKTFSHRLGIAKPDTAIYTHAAEGLGVPVDAILFVDDRAENVLAARAAGMSAIRYCGHAEFVIAMQNGNFAHLL